MEEQEAPLEDVHEEIHHHAEHSRQGWVMGVAVSTAVLAAIAAIASLLSGDNVNEAMIEQIQAADQWNYYQAKGIKSGQLATRIAILESLGKPVKQQDRAKLEDYAKQQDEIQKQASEAKASAEHHMKRHHVLAKSVTWSQIAIAISAISVLTKQKWFWVVGLAFGCAGLVFLVWGAIA
ncbi:MAG TPA: DUF4337 domain-containing protein [Tepidisphaeraceae bacterium]|nr:DUF4337 domain-containing protein [Tepidisphaeraceae bacterium]